MPGPARLALRPVSHYRVLDRRAAASRTHNQPHTRRPRSSLTSLQCLLQSRSITTHTQIKSSWAAASLHLASAPLSWLKGLHLLVKLERSVQRDHLHTQRDHVSTPNRGHTTTAAAAPWTVPTLLYRLLHHGRCTVRYLLRNHLYSRLHFLLHHTISPGRHQQPATCPVRNAKISPAGSERWMCTTVSISAAR